MARTTLFLLAILVTGPVQSPMWAVKLVHLMTGRALARENYIQFSIFYCYAQFLQQSTYLLLFIFIWLAVAPSHSFCLYRVLLAIQLPFSEVFLFFFFFFFFEGASF